MKNIKEDVPVKPVRIGQHQPGSLLQQLCAIAGFFDERRAGYGKREAWQRSREKWIPHVRPREGEA